MESDNPTMKRVKKAVKNLIKAILPSYATTSSLLHCLNGLLVTLRRRAVHSNSVLHVSYMVHIAYYTVQLLRRQGIKADYLAVETSPVWNKSDFVYMTHPVGAVRAVREMLTFWWVIAKYEIVHLHFGISLSESGWEFPLLKAMGRKIVIHYRGCEIRDQALNMRLHPNMNICQQCDYKAVACSGAAVKKRRELAGRFGDLFLVTTPDMLDFIPTATHFPFFCPTDELIEVDRAQCTKRSSSVFKIVHATNHPGIEGTEAIARVINRLKERGYAIEFVFLTRVAPQRVLEECLTADLTIGKMKMGYYANAQIESMFLGVPTVTYVRPDFVTKELQESGFILSSLEDLEATLEHYLSNPEALQQKREIARSSILKLHDNDELAKRMVQLYRTLKS